MVELRPHPNSDWPEMEDFYVQCKSLPAFRKVFRAIAKNEPKIPEAKTGAIVNEDRAVHLPDGRAFCAVSCRRDIEGWKRYLAGWCQFYGLQHGAVQGDRFVVSTGETFAMKDCRVEAR